MNIEEVVSKTDRSYISRPWKGLIPQIFSKTADLLVHPRRHDWKHLTLFLKAIVPAGDTVLFKRCDACLEFPLQFYDRRFKEYFNVTRTTGDRECAQWIVSTESLISPELRCGLTLVGRLDRFFVYGPKNIEIQEALAFDRDLRFSTEAVSDK